MPNFGEGYGPIVAFDGVRPPPATVTPCATLIVGEGLER